MKESSAVRRNAMFLIAVLIGAGLLGRTAPAQERTDQIAVPAGVHPFVDGLYLAELHELDHVLHPPVPQNVALVLDRPWEGPQSGYGTVLRDPASGEFRLYYRGGGDVTTREVTCVAVSEDGINWRRSELSIVSFDGATTTNIVWTAREFAYGESHNFAPFVDTNPACAPDARYKAVGIMKGLDEQGERRVMLGALASPDGLHWRRLSEEPVLRHGAFDSLNTAFWDPTLGRYVCYFRVPRNGLRSFARATSPDFLNWSAPEELEFRPQQTEHYYTNGITLYPRTPGLYLAFPMRFVPQRTAIGRPPRTIDGTSDAVFLTSRDGRRWTRTFREAFIRPGLNPANWGDAHGNNTPLNGLLETAPDELSIFWFDNCADVPSIRRGTLRLDGFASLRAGADEGEAITTPLKIEGTRLSLNLATSAVGYVKVECLDAAGRPVPGWQLAECEEIFGDEIERPVVWKGGDVLPAVRPLRLRFVLRDADLYAFTVK
ncbi:MAG: hypothetical protein Kow0059_19280 [Candidatus Sumerlaeia bacterium]